MTRPHREHSFHFLKLLKWKLFFSERPACRDVNFIADKKVPLGIPAETAATLRSCGLTALDGCEPGGLQLSRAWRSSDSWMGLFSWGFGPMSPPWPSTGIPAQPSWLSFLSSEPRPRLLFYCRLQAWVACGGYQLMNKLQSSCPVINLSRRSKMKHADLYSFKW